MKKLDNITKKIFGTITVCVLFLGGLSLVGYVIALLIGGDQATLLCEFIYKDYFPIVIQISTFGVGIGLLNMYIKK